LKRSFFFFWNSVALYLTWIKCVFTQFRSPVMNGNYSCILSDSNNPFLKLHYCRLGVHPDGRTQMRLSSLLSPHTAYCNSRVTSMLIVFVFISLIFSSGPLCIRIPIILSTESAICVKLSLCLTNWALRHDGEWGSRCIDPHFLDLDTRWRWEVSFMPWPLYPRGKSPCYPLDRKLGGPQSWPGRHGEEKIIGSTGTRALNPRSSSL
jgi:hypothetical protein